MDEINPTMETVDVAIVIGANDVVNPLARTDPQQPHRRHADHRRRQGPHGDRHQAQPQPRLRRHPQPAVRRRKHADALRGWKKAVLDIIAAIKENA
jgi:H+-translocating NAD(P) transhydrogenase subunit beta